MAASMTDGRIKMYVTAQALRQRREFPGLFTRGTYRGLEVQGSRREQAFSFMRSSDSQHAVVVAPRLFTRVIANGLPCGEEVWQDTNLHLPKDAASVKWHNIFTGQSYKSRQVGEDFVLRMSDVLADFPVALLTARP